MFVQPPHSIKLRAYWIRECRTQYYFFYHFWVGRLCALSFKGYIYCKTWKLQWQGYLNLWTTIKQTSVFDLWTHLDLANNLFRLEKRYYIQRISFEVKFKVYSMHSTGLIWGGKVYSMHSTGLVWGGMVY